jgi:hypothetical protein
MPLVSTVSTLAAPIREFFTLRAAEGAIAARPAVLQSRVETLVAAAERRLLAGRRVSEPVAASLLLREAVVQFARASQIARGAPEDPVELPRLPPDPARPRADPSDDARARAAVASDDPLYFDQLSAEDAERARWALDRAAGLLRRRVDARSLLHVRATRWGRWAAAAILVAWAAVALARRELLPRDIALGKPVHPSSTKAVLEHTLTDGVRANTVAVHTTPEDNSNVVIDLEAPYWISTIKVYNRQDGWFDDCLPLVAEVSLDGKTYAEVERRDTHFDTWVVDAGGRPGRYVRLRVARHSYVALSQVQVFGKKQ